MSSGPLWVPGAERLRVSAPGGSMDYPHAGPRGVAHTTESPSGGRGNQPDYWFRLMERVLRGKSAEPNLLYDPLTDKLGQFIPLNLSGRALQNDGGRRSNRVGKVCVQIEFVGWASRPFTRNWKPGKNYVSMMESIGAWGVPDVFASGPPPAYPGGHDGRERGIWYSKAGWYGHSQVPANSHGDPGAISTKAFFSQGEPDQSEPGAPSSETWPAWVKYPGTPKMGAGAGSKAPVNLLIKSALIVNGYDEFFQGGPVHAEWTPESTKAIAAYQHKHKLDGKGTITQATWRHLGRMFSSAPDFPGAKEFKVGEATVPSLQGQALMALQGFAGALGNRLTWRWRPAGRTAVRRFQLSEPALRVDPDGLWGPLTWKKAWTDSN